MLGDLSGSPWVLGVVVFVVSFAITTAIVVAFLVHMPPDHFVRKEHSIRGRLRSPVARVALAIGKNALGVLLVIAGILLSVPGVPGQGLLTILVGLLLLDIPGKRKLERRLVSRPRIRRAIDGIRGRFGRPPLELDDGARDG